MLIFDNVCFKSLGLIINMYRIYNSQIKKNVMKNKLVDIAWRKYYFSKISLLKFSICVEVF